MSKILIASEYATSHVKLAKIAMLADHFQNEGHRVFVMSAGRKRTDLAQLYITTLSDATTIPGITHLLNGYSGREPTSFAELLLNGGYSSPRKITQNLKSLIYRFKRIQPDYILAYESPTVVLAAKLAGVDVKIMNLGDHRFIPPKGHEAFPSFADTWVPSERLELMDTVLLGNVRKAVSPLSTYPIESLGVFFTENDAIEGWSYLDPFGREEGNFVGVVNPYNSFMPVQWQSAPQSKRILCHLDTEHAEVTGVLCAALRDVEAEKIAHLYGDSPARRSFISRIARPDFTIRERPMNYDMLLNGADLLVCHFNRDLLTVAAQKGVPAIVINRTAYHTRVTQCTRATQWLTTTDTVPGLHGWRSMVTQALHDTPKPAALIAVQRDLVHEIPTHAASRVLSQLTRH